MRHTKRPVVFGVILALLLVSAPLAVADGYGTDAPGEDDAFTIAWADYGWVWQASPLGVILEDGAPF